VDPQQLLRLDRRPAPDTTRRARTVWGAAVCIYLVAVFHRTSLGVAGLLAAHRFGIGASQLAAFTVLQLVVYAGMQIPVGLLADRYGPRRLLTCGLIVMTAAQTAFALSASFPGALAARAVLGCGDALTFVSVLRLISAWFPARRGPLVTQLTGFIGTTGNLAGAYPLGVALRDFGWTPTYLAAALIGGCALVLPLAVIRDRPSGHEAVPDPHEGEPATPAREPVRTQLRTGWAEPGTRLGFWVHFTTPFAGGVFGLLWGFPFLVQGEGLSSGTASGLLTLMVAEAMVLGPTYGLLTGRRPGLRLPLVAAVVLVNAAAWAAVLLWPGRAPLWLLVLLVAALGTGGSASLVGFEIARATNPGHRTGTVSGMVNVGGFSAMVVLLVVIGWTLDATGSGTAGHYPLAGFKAAFAAQYVLFALGATQIFRLSRTLRRRAAALPPSSARPNPGTAEAVAG
jgi:cyanate permease